MDASMHDAFYTNDAELTDVVMVDDFYEPLQADKVDDVDAGSDDAGSATSATTAETDRDGATSADDAFEARPFNDAESTTSNSAYGDATVLAPTYSFRDRIERICELLDKIDKLEYLCERLAELKSLLFDM